MIKIHIALVGGGPACLMLLKRLIELNTPAICIDIFERSRQVGAGMPYSRAGANKEHITNVSANEIPELVTPMTDWVKTLPQETLDDFFIDAARFNEYKVLPRLLFGDYLFAQFNLLLQQAEAKGICVNIHTNTAVTDVAIEQETGRISLYTAAGRLQAYDYAVICTGHTWPVKSENAQKNFFESPYPPAKLCKKVNYPVALRGSSLTAIDAIATLACSNGRFVEDGDRFRYELDPASQGFRIVMHSRNGFLPAVRFHLEDALFATVRLTKEEVEDIRAKNDGFLSLDVVFETKFKQKLRDKEPELYRQVKDMNVEAFVEFVSGMRENMDAFDMLQLEYAEAEKSIQQKRPVYWKELLSMLSIEMNYPAKYFSAEDMQRLQKVLMPLISVVIAFIPQTSAKELMALHDAGLLELVTVAAESRVEPHPEQGCLYYYNEDESPVHFQMYVDCIGQPHLQFNEFPFRTLLAQQAVAPALLRFQDRENGKAEAEKNRQVFQSEEGDYYLTVPGIAINDYFQVVDEAGQANSRLYVMAVPLIGGYNPDYSGLDFCEAASALVAEALAGLVVEKQVQV